MVSPEIVLMTMLIMKHLIFDFFLQGPYQYLNKGKYLHPGGLLHAGLAVLGSLLVLFLFYNGMRFVAPDGTFNQRGLSRIDYVFDNCLDLPLIFTIVLGTEALIHYHMDWLKVKICRKMGWTASNSNWYFHLLGIDQTVHYLTYVGMIILVFWKPLWN